MGKITTQSIQNSVLSYIGIVLGTIYTIFIIPKAFNNNPDDWGIIQLVTSYVILFMSFAQLGFSSILIKFWPQYSDNKNKQGIIFFFFILIITGLITVTAIILLFKRQIFYSTPESYNKISALLPYLLIVFAINTLFQFYIYFSWVFQKTAYTTFLRETFLKIWTFILIVLYYYNQLSFNIFFNLYFLGYAIQLIAIYIYSRKSFNIPIKIDLSVFKNKPQLKEILKYGSFSFLTGIATVLVARIDLIMINKYVNLDSVAYYSIAIFFIAVVQVPVRALIAIASPIISQNMSINNISAVKAIYSKSSQNLFLVSSIILMCIIANINEFMVVLGDKFGQIKYTIIILGIARLYEIINQMSSSIISYSNHFRYDIIFESLLLVLTVISNIIFIPLFGINGAALATAISIIIYTSAKAIFVYQKFKIHPYCFNSLKILFVLILSLSITTLIPALGNLYITIVLKSTFILITFTIAILFLNISDDFKTLLVKNNPYKKIRLLKIPQTKYIQIKEGI